jgi:hypothetical protein
MSIGWTESAFDDGKDIPADQLHMTFKRPAQVYAFKIDTASIIELNERAEKLWNDLVACHGSPEKARQAYFHLDKKCDMDKEIKNYSLSVQTFLTSTEPIPKDAFLILEYHPLFTETLLENAVATNFLPSLDYTEKNFQIRHRRDKALKYLVEGHLPQEIDQVVKLPNGYNYLYLQEIKNFKEFDQIFASSYREINSITLLRFNQRNKECESLGLWPAANRVLTNYMVSDFGAQILGTDEIRKVYEQACGEFKYTNSPYSGNTTKSFDILKQFRALANRFSNPN